MGKNTQDKTPPSGPRPAASVSDRLRVELDGHRSKLHISAAWAQRLTSLELKELMRHESVSTTERYYVGQNAERLGETLWKCYGK